MSRKISSIREPTPDCSELTTPDPKYEFSDSLARSALWAGLKYNEIPRLTPQEIQKAVGVESDRQKDFYKMLAYIVYTGASLATVGFNNPKQFPSIEQAFPNLFEREEQQDWRIMKQRVELFAKAKKQESQ